MDIIVYEIHCDKCGKVTGKLELPAEKWTGITITNEMVGIESSLCDSCG